MADDIKFEFTEVRNEVAATERTLNSLMSTVKNLDKERLSNLKKGFDDLGKITAFRELADSAKTNLAKIEEVMSRKKVDSGIIASLRAEKSELEKTLAEMKDRVTQYTADLGAIHKRRVRNQVDLAIQEADKGKQTYSIIETNRSKHIQAVTDQNEKQLQLDRSFYNAQQALADKQAKAEEAKLAKLSAQKEKQLQLDRSFDSAASKVISRAEEDRYQTTLAKMAADKLEADARYVAVVKDSRARGKDLIIGAARKQLVELNAEQDALALAESKRYQTTLARMAASQAESEDRAVALRKDSLARGKDLIIGAARKQLTELNAEQDALALAESKRYQTTLARMAATKDADDARYIALRKDSLARGREFIIAPAQQAVAQSIADDKMNSRQARVDRMFDAALLKATPVTQPLADSRLPEHVKNTDDLAKAFKRLGIEGNDVHSAMRGLASGFGLLWLTWGNLLPLFAGSAISFGTKGVVELGSSIEHTMQTIRVLSEESSDSVQGLNTQLIELAKSGPLGPKEIAEGMKTLSLAGLKVGEVSSSIKDVMNFSVAGDTTLKVAADVMTSVATAFSISAANYNYVGDVISKTAATSKASVESIGEAFKTSSVLSKLYGVTLEDVGVGLAALSNLGIQGSAAGTALRNMYIDFSGRTPKAAKVLKDLKLEVMDSSGKFKDLITLTKDLDSALSNYSGRGDTKKMADIFSERGGKPIVELRALAQERARAFGTTFGSELERIRDEITNSEGFMIRSATQLALTAENQMKSVGSTLKAVMVDAFDGMSPYVVAISGQLKDLFNSEEFKAKLTGLTNLVLDFTSGLIRVGEVVVNHLGAIALLAAAYAAMPSVISAATALWGMASATIAADTVALQANTAARLTATAAQAGFFTRLLGFLPGVGTALMIAGGAWMAYETWVSNSKRAQEGFVKSGYTDNLIEKLNEETKRLTDNTEAKMLNMSVTEMQARKAAASDKGDAAARVHAIERQITDLEDQLTTSEHGVALASGQKIANANINARIKAKREELVLAQDEQAIDKMRLDAAIAANVAAAKLAKESIKTATGKATGLEGDSPSSKATKAIRQPIIREAQIKDSIAAIQRQGEAELKAETDVYNTNRKILESEHSNNLINEGQYEASLLKLVEDHATKRILIAQNTIAKEIEANEKYNLAERERTASNIASIQKSGISAEDKADRTKNAEKQLANELESLNQRTIANVTKSQTEIQGIIDDSYLRRLEAAHKFYGQNFKLIEEQRMAQEKAERAIANTKAHMALSRQYDMVTDSTMAFVIAEKAAAEATLQATQAQVEELAKLEDQYKKNAKAIDSFRAQSILDGKADDPEFKKQLDRMQESVTMAQDAIDKAKARSRMEVANAASNAYQQVLDKDNARLKQGVSEALTSAIFEGGNSGRKKLHDLLVAELRKPIRLALDVFVNNVAGGLSNAVFGSSSGGGGILGAFGSVGSAASGSSTAAGWLNTAAETPTAYGAAIGTTNVAPGSQAWMLAQQGEGLGAAGLVSTSESAAVPVLAEGSTVAAGGAGAMSTVMNAAPYLAAAIAAYAIISSMNGGENRQGASYNLDPLKNTVFKSQGASWSDQQNTPVQAQTQSTVASINSLLATFGSGSKVEQWMSGLESSSQGKGFAYAGGTINGKVFGENDISMKTLSSMTPEESLLAYTADLQRSVVEALQVADLGGEIGKYVNKLGNVEALSGEAMATISLNITNFQAFTKIMEKAPFPYLVKASVEAAAALTAAAGTLDVLTSSLTNYYNLFTTADEKIVDTSALLSAEFNKLGKAMPTTGLKDWYKAQVAAAGAADLSVAANAKTYTTLLLLADGVNTVGNAAEEVAKTRLNWQNQLAVLLGTKTDLQISLENDLLDVRDAATISLIKAVYAEKMQKAAFDKKVTEAKAVFDRSSAAEKTRLEALVTASQTVVDSLQPIFDALKSAATDLYNQVAITANASGNSGSSIIDSALASGILPTKAVLDTAITAAKQQVDSAVYASQADADFAKLTLANKLTALQGIAGTQLDSATAQLTELKAQVTKLDEMITYSAKLVDIANGIDLSIIDVSTALNTLLGLSKTPQGKTPVVTDNSSAVFSGVQGAGSSGGTSGFYQQANLGNGVFNTQVTDPAAIARYFSIQSSVSSMLSGGASLADIADTAKQYGVSIADLSIATGYNVSDMTNAFNLAGIPAFASGGLHSGGVRLVGENGPELEVTGPARYYDANTTAGMVGGGMSQEAEDAIISMSAELAQLRRDHAKLLESMKPVGDAYSGRQRVPLLTAAG